jgi:CDP-6-deoxy-D-xylo-4-hexulose-3-dehydrase
MTLAPDAPITRNQLAEHLEKNKIQTRNLFAGNLTRHPCFESLREGIDYRIASPLLNTDTIMNQSLWIGVYPGMTARHITYMTATIQTLLDFKERI